MKLNKLLVQGFKSVKGEETLIVDSKVTILIGHMKTMTCAQLGGPCEAKITGNTPDEMMMNGMKHLESAHPKMAADVKAAPKDDPKMMEWNKKFKKDWAKTP